MMTLPSNVLASGPLYGSEREREEEKGGGRERERRGVTEGSRWSDRVQMQCNYGDKIVLAHCETDDTAHLRGTKTQKNHAHYLWMTYFASM